jgi:hypothetical protein
MAVCSRHQVDQLAASNFSAAQKVSGPEISSGPALHLPQPIMALGPWLAIWLPLTKFPAAYYPIGQVSRKRRA